ncbi:MAG TPA: hypothetical protein VK862_07850, partial [Afifellaceae bacterium]|nr:hypothetical protein [Afifellaceae bacterium]
MRLIGIELPDLGQDTRAQFELGGVPDGLEGRLMGDLVRNGPARRYVFVARNAERADMVGRSLRFFAPDVDIIDFPAWDCLPYDRVSPNADIS